MVDYNIQLHIVIIFNYNIKKGEQMSKLVTERTVINELTGEVTHAERHIISTERLDREPPYIKMYIQDIGHWQGLTSGETAILHLVSSTVDYDGVVTLSKYAKDKIKKTLGVTDGFIRNTISKLVSKSMLLKTEDYSGVYKLNPFWFGRGEWKDILEQRKAFVVQITRAYGVELPKSAADGVTFLNVQEAIEKHRDEKEREELEAIGQTRLID